MPRLNNGTFLVHVMATLFMVGAIWFIQVVHYPLLDRVPGASWTAYEAAHVRLTISVMIPVMTTEAVTGLLLLWRKPAGVRQAMAWAGVGLLAIIWCSSLLLQVPLHQVLAGGFDPSAHRALVISNWIRTLAWSARGLLVLRMMSGLMRGVSRGAISRHPVLTSMPPMPWVLRRPSPILAHTRDRLGGDGDVECAQRGGRSKDPRPLPGKTPIVQGTPSEPRTRA